MDKDEVIAKLLEALIWCTGHSDFAPGGKFHVGWKRVGRPAIDAGYAALPDRTTIEHAEVEKPDAED